MKGLTSVALLTFKEAIRNRVLYLLLFFGVVFVFGSRIAGLLTVGDEVKIIQDMGLTTLTLLDLLLAIFVGIDLVHKEMERRTIFVVLAKPVTRTQFILGKTLGFSATLLLIHVAMSLLFWGFLAVMGGFHARIVLASLTIYLEMLVVVSVAVLFSSITTPILSGIFTLGFWIIGRGARSLLALAERLPEGVFRWFIEGLYYVLPDLDRFHLQAYAVHGVPVTGDYLLALPVVALVYVALMMSLTVIIFERRNFV